MEGNGVRRGRLKEFWRRLKKNKSAVIGMVLLGIIIVCALLAPILIPEEQVYAQDAMTRLLPPSAKNWFGTDVYGRDVFARVMYGARISLFIGFAAAFLSLITGGTLGAITAYYGGRIDDIIMRIMDMIMSIPSTLLALCIVAALGGSAVNLFIAMALSSMPQFCRLARSAMLSVVDLSLIHI